MGGASNGNDLTAGNRAVWTFLKHMNVKKVLFLCPCALRRQLKCISKTFQNFGTIDTEGQNRCFFYPALGMRSKMFQILSALHAAIRTLGSLLVQCLLY